METFKCLIAHYCINANFIRPQSSAARLPSFSPASDLLIYSPLADKEDKLDQTGSNAISSFAPKSPIPRLYSSPTESQPPSSDAKSRANPASDLNAYINNVKSPQDIGKVSGRQSIAKIKSSLKPKHPKRSPSIGYIGRNPTLEKIANIGDDGKIGAGIVNAVIDEMKANGIDYSNFNEPQNRETLNALLQYNKDTENSVSTVRGWPSED